MTHRLAIASLNDFIFGRCPDRSLRARIGNWKRHGHSEINFTLPQIDINEQTWGRFEGNMPDDRGCLPAGGGPGSSGLLVEFETLPEMTIHPDWGLNSPA